MFGFEFGERVLFRRLPVSAKLAWLDSLWNIGVFVGYRSTTGEYMVVGRLEFSADRDGVAKMWSL